ncbi:baseplate J/gp47 family protein [Picosynechococcus sp. PCC 7117]|uniref:baseplate J/gp47 family protein n=1 Tax=Picosynechococcus sp. PCC 7117 TaxID=195498 RepID=UPI000810E102|nr:baseplate J/gp47 family protein [Picosynechococcus sp. PCC 7117]ANV88503.1 hypothetical protein AWQ22_14105 [Picosynechococcus sp. PCC 7117]
MEDINNLIPLDEVILDNRNEEELFEQARVRVFNSSQGTLNDFTENSPLASILQGQVFAGAEFLFYANQLPLALVVDFLKVTGVQRNLGTKAKVTLTFSITAPQPVSYVIPAGFEVVDVTSKYSYFTDSTLTIPPGLTQGSITATAEEVGSAYNLPAYSINNFIQPLTFLAGVTNTANAAGGTDEEPIATTIKRAIEQLNLKNLVSATDYELAAQEILGDGSRCKAIGLLGAQKQPGVLGAVHLFLINANKDPANDAQLTQVKSALSSRIQLGTSLYVSPMELINVSGDLIAELAEDVSPTEAADDLWQAYQEYLDPSTYPIDEDVILNEVEYQLRLTGVINKIQSLELNDLTSNIALPNAYTLPNAYSLTMTLIDSEGVVWEMNRGAGEFPDFEPTP